MNENLEQLGNQECNQEKMPFFITLKALSNKLMKKIVIYTLTETITFFIPNVQVLCKYLFFNFLSWPLFIIPLPPLKLKEPPSGE